MDALRAEIANKRKALEAPSAEAQPAQKYMRKGDLQRLQQEREREEAAAAAAASSAAKQDELLRVSTPTLKDGAPSPSSEPNRSGTGTPAPNDPSSSSAFNLSDAETARRLRSKGQPIRLFGETPRDARLRLRALELIEERGGERHGGQNDFKRALEEVESRERERKAQDAATTTTASDANDSSGKAGEGKKKGEKEEGAVSTAGTEVLDLGMLKTEEGRSKLYPVIYHALKRILKEWEEAMNARPESVKRTTQGMRAAAMQNQSADYLKPLFKNLRSKNMPDDVLGRIAEIVHHTQKREYQKANDAYLRLSIGNAPWPIGVTMVGIHERSAREKISADQVAHVLNDEVSRKYIQSLKRLITFSQTAHPPEDSSQLMG